MREFALRTKLGPPSAQVPLEGPPPPPPPRTPPPTPDWAAPSRTPGALQKEPRGVGGRGRERAGREGLWLEGRVLQLQWGMGGDPPNTSWGQTHIWGLPETGCIYVAVNDSHGYSTSLVCSWNEVSDVLCQMSSSAFCTCPLAKADFRSRFFGKGMRRNTCQWKGGRHSVKHGFGEDFHRKGNLMRRSRPFSEQQDSEN